MDKIVDQLMCEVGRVYKEQGDLPDELLSALYFVLKTPLQSALDFIDRRNVSLLCSPSGRSLFQLFRRLNNSFVGSGVDCKQVIGNSGLPYICFAESNYCECLAYRYSVLKKKEFVMCKHVVAVRLSEAMSSYSVHHITNEQMAALLKAMN